MAAPVRQVVIPYAPRPEFLEFHLRKQRWAAIVAHRRAGKTVACVNELIKGALTCPLPNPRFAYLAPYYAQAKDVAWNYLKQYTAPIPGAVVNESELRVDLPGGRRIRLYGADNYDRIRGVYLDGVVLDEYADMDPRVWPQVIRPALSDRKGWATFIGTPKGRNDFFHLVDNASKSPDWFSAVLKASETGIVDAAELADARAAMSPEQYEQEYECSFDAAIMGAYYGKEIADAERDGRILELEVDPTIPVHTAWDLGKEDSTSIFFFQVAPNGIAVLDHYENHGFDLDHYVAEVRARGYRYGTHYLPHDARARILGMKRTRLEQLLVMLKPDKCSIVINHSVEDGINAARMTLKHSWFDEAKCREALEALRQYRTEYDEKNKVFKTTPKHNWASHTADAYRYLAMAWRELRPPEQRKPRKPDTYVAAAPGAGLMQSTMTMDELVRRAERRAKR